MDTQPVALSVNTKVAFPSEIPVITPLLFMVATAGLLLAHVPPVDGFIEVVLPIQIELGPLRDNTFFAMTTIGTSVIELQPVARL